MQNLINTYEKGKITFFKYKMTTSRVGNNPPSLRKMETLFFAPRAIIIELKSEIIIQNFSRKYVGCEQDCKDKPTSRLFQPDNILPRKNITVSNNRDRGYIF